MGAGSVSAGDRGPGTGAGPSFCGAPAVTVSRGVRRRGSQAYLWPTGTSARRHDLLGAPRLRGVRPLILCRPSAWPCAAGLVAADKHLAGAGRGYAPSGECGAPVAVPGNWHVTARAVVTVMGSRRGERVVAELPGVGLVGLGMPLAAPQRGRVGPLGDMRLYARPRPAPRPHTATRCTPPARTRRPRGRRTGPAKRAGAPGRPARSARAAAPQCRYRDSRR